MKLDIERLTAAAKRQMGKMDLEDMTALKLCLLSTGTLVGLSLKDSFSRRLAGTACSFLAAGLAIPLVSQFLDELELEQARPEPLSKEEET